MQVIQVTATAGADGRLRLDIPTGAAGATFDVAVVLHGVPAANGTGHQPTLELMRTCGAIDDDTFDARRPTDPPPDNSVSSPESLASLYGCITDDAFIAPSRGMPREVPALDSH